MPFSMSNPGSTDPVNDQATQVPEHSRQIDE
jgi:hypothetical protein